LKGREEKEEDRPRWLRSELFCVSWKLKELQRWHLSEEKSQI